jgi:alpha-beta hydrolase superfamily lysophospholipase
LTITATDNQLIVGTLYDPDLKPPKPPASEEEEEEAAAEEAGGEEGEEVTTPAAPPKPAKTYPLVILMHQLNGSASDWGDLPKTLVKQGYAVIALDLRGHGRSTKMLNGSARQWRDYSPQDWAKLPSDARRVMETFTGSKDYPEVNGSKVAIIGASIGANAALIRGAEAADRVKAVVLLSPGLDYKGLTTSIPAVKYPNAVFIATSQTDTSSFEATELLYRWAQGPKALRVYKDVGHGTDMLSVEPGLTKDLLTWLAKHFPSGSSTASKPAAEKTHAEAKAAHSSPAAHH